MVLTLPGPDGWLAGWMQARIEEIEREPAKKAAWPAAAGSSRTAETIERRANGVAGELRRTDRSPVSQDRACLRLKRIIN